MSLPKAGTGPVAHARFGDRQLFRRRVVVNGVTGDFVQDMLRGGVGIVLAITQLEGTIYNGPRLGGQNDPAEV